MNATCMWCHETLTFSVGKGWVHGDGQMYRSHQEWRVCPKCKDSINRDLCPRCEGEGRVCVTVDEHCALPGAAR